MVASKRDGTGLEDVAQAPARTGTSHPASALAARRRMRVMPYLVCLGDQANELSFALLRVTFVSPLPSAFMT
jgi:hypothetical protein